MDRCNLTILERAGTGRPGAISCAANQVEIVASMPCYLEDNVDRSARQGRVRRLDPRPAATQRARLWARGSAAHAQSRLQSAGSVAAAAAGRPGSRLQAVLGERYGIVFNSLYTLANMPIQRFGAHPDAKGEFDGYLDLLQDGACRCQSRRRYVPEPDLRRLAGLCLRLRLQPDARPAARFDGRARVHLADLLDADLTDAPIRVAGHCYGCSAGQGSSCGGALKEAAE